MQLGLYTTITIAINSVAATKIYGEPPLARRLKSSVRRLKGTVRRLKSEVC